MKSSAALVAISLALGGCVAPEAPDPPRVAAPTRPAVSNAQLEDAPVPNNRLGGPNDSVIQFKK